MKLPTTRPPSRRRRDPAEQFRKATELIVAGLRRMGHDDAAVRRKAVAAFREAVAGEKPWVKSLPLPGRPEPEDCVSTAGIYRLVIEAEGLDRGDQRQQETWFAVVRRALDELLGAD